jgi:hypothetical protein
MEPNSILPVLITAVIIVLVASVAAALVLWWNKEPRVQQLVRRAWLALIVLSALAVAVFWISTAMIGLGRSTPDRSLQQKQSDELHRRLEKGSH